MHGLFVAFAGVAGKAIEIGGKEGALSLGKRVAVDCIFYAASYSSLKLAEHEGLPPEINILLSLGIGITVTKVAGKYILKDAKGAVLGEIHESTTEGTSSYKVLTSEEAESFAFDAIKGRNKSDAVMLGKYEKNSSASYDEMAKAYDCQYFNLDNYDELATQYSRDEIWKINEKFLDIETSSGREIYLSHNPELNLGKGTFYSHELQYLVNNGYHFVKEGEIWHAIR